MKTSAAWERSEAQTEGDNEEKEEPTDGNSNCVQKKFI